MIQKKKGRTVELDSLDQSSMKRMCLVASLALAMIIFSALEMSWGRNRDEGETLLC